MTWSIVLSILASLLLGTGILVLFHGRAVFQPRLAAVHFVLAAGIGLGASSCLYFLWLLTFGRASRYIVVVELALALSCAIAGLLGSNRTPSSVPDEPAVRGFVRKYLFGGVLVLCFGFGIVQWDQHFSAHSRLCPHGQWDAWAIWNVRARYLALSGYDWERAFHKNMSHPDYPLLLPASVARVWSISRTTATSVPIAMAACFTFGIPLLLAASVSMLRGRELGLLAGLFALGTSNFLLQGAWQQADIPLAFFILASLASAAIYDFSNGPGHLSVAALAAGLAAWTKNEGVVFFVGFVLARLGIALTREGIRGAVIDCLRMAQGAALPVLCLTIFKLCYAPPSYLVSHTLCGLPIPETSVEARLPIILRAFAREAVAMRGWPCHVGFFLLAAYLLLAGVRFSRVRFSSFLAVLAPLGVLLAADVGVFMITPCDVEWQLLSLNRLFIQLLPGFLFGYFLLVGEPWPEVASGIRSL